MPIIFTTWMKQTCPLINTSYTNYHKEKQKILITVKKVCWRNCIHNSKPSHRENYMSLVLHRWILPKFKEEIISILYPSSLRKFKKKNIFQFTLWGQNYPDIKIKDISRKSQINIAHEHRHKNPWNILVNQIQESIK